MHETNHIYAAFAGTGVDNRRGTAEISGDQKEGMFYPYLETCYDIYKLNRCLNVLLQKKNTEKKTYEDVQHVNIKQFLESVDILKPWVSSIPKADLNAPNKELVGQQFAWVNCRFFFEKMFGLQSITLAWDCFKEKHPLFGPDVELPELVKIPHLVSKEVKPLPENNYEINFVFKKKEKCGMSFIIIKSSL